MTENNTSDAYAIAQHEAADEERNASDGEMECSNDVMMDEFAVANDEDADEDAGVNDDADADEKQGEKRPIEEVKGSDEHGPLPTLPLKRARTAYFIFADEKRDEVKQKHQGEGVAAIARAIGQLWVALEPSEKEVYEKQAARERDRVSRDTQRLKDAGMWPDANADGTAGGGGGQDDDAVIFPIGRIRKICKLDPDVKGMSKESTLLITKATELFCTQLGKECITMASMQNRRKLMPDDVVEVCSVKERFMFLKPDLVDLRRAQIEEMGQKGKENGNDGKGGSGKAGEESGSGVKTLDSYFGKVRNT